jgi:molecular chaperone GrpE
MPDSRNTPIDDEHDEAQGSDDPFAEESADEEESLRAEIDNLRTEKQALYEKLARVQADFQNSQRRLEKDMDQRLKIAAGQLVKAFLPVLDNLERAMEVPETADVRTVVEGVRGTYEQWMDVLRRNGVEVIAPEPGTPFDPNRMEALMQEAGDYDGPTVTRLLARGYLFEGRVLRPAQVAVSRPKE